MESPYRPLTPYDATHATSLAREIAERTCAAVDAYRADGEETERLTACRCKSCWYFRRSRIGGSAMTVWYCGICSGRQMAGSMVQRRRRWPEPATKGTR